MRTDLWSVIVAASILVAVPTHALDGTDQSVEGSAADRTVALPESTGKPTVVELPRDEFGVLLTACSLAQLTRTLMAVELLPSVLLPDGVRQRRLHQPVTYEGRPLRYALDQVTAALPPYTWRERPPFVEIRPTTDRESLLDAEVSRFEVADVDMSEALSAVRRIGDPNAAILRAGTLRSVFTSTLDPKEEDASRKAAEDALHKRISVAVDQTTVRGVLDALVKAYGSGAWVSSDTPERKRPGPPCGSYSAWTAFPSNGSLDGSGTMRSHTRISSGLCSLGGAGVVTMLGAGLTGLPAARQVPVQRPKPARPRTRRDDLATGLGAVEIARGTSCRPRCDPIRLESGSRGHQDQARSLRGGGRAALDRPVPLLDTVYPNAVVALRSVVKMLAPGFSVEPWNFPTGRGERRPAGLSEPVAVRVVGGTIRDVLDAIARGFHGGSWIAHYRSSSGTASGMSIHLDTFQNVHLMVQVPN